LRPASRIRRRIAGGASVAGRPLASAAAFRDNRQLFG